MSGADLRVLNEYPQAQSFSAFSNIYNNSGLFGIQATTVSHFFELLQFILFDLVYSRQRLICAFRDLSCAQLLWSMFEISQTLKLVFNENFWSF